MRCNLLEETLNMLARNGKAPEDVLAILWDKFKPDEYGNISNSVDHYYCKWQDFLKFSNRVYDNGYGGVEINQTIIVLGKDWWLERREYDGAEWWEYCEKPSLNSRVYNSSIDLRTPWEQIDDEDKDEYLKF